MIAAAASALERHHKRGVLVVGQILDQLVGTGAPNAFSAVEQIGDGRPDLDLLVWADP